MLHALLFALAAMTATPDVAQVEKAAEPTKDNSELATFFDAFSKKRDQIRTLEAQFVQSIVSQGEAVEAHGTLVYMNPRRILFRYDEKQGGTTYLIDKRRAYQYDPDIKQAQVFDLTDNAQTEVFFLGFDANVDVLTQAYDLSLFAPDSKAAPGATQGLSIRPKKELPSTAEDLSRDTQAAPFQEVKLYLREADYLPVRIEILNEDKSHTSINVSDFEINKELDPARAEIAVPEGTKVYADDQLIETIGSGGAVLPRPVPTASEPVIQSTELPPPGAAKP